MSLISGLPRKYINQKRLIDLYLSKSLLSKFSETITKYVILRDSNCGLAVEETSKSTKENNRKTQSPICHLRHSNVNWKAGAMQQV